MGVSFVKRFGIVISGVAIFMTGVVIALATGNPGWFTLCFVGLFSLSFAAAEVKDAWIMLRNTSKKHLHSPQFGWKLLMIVGFIQVLIGTSVKPIETPGAILALIGLGCAIRGARGLQKSAGG